MLQLTRTHPRSAEYGRARKKQILISFALLTVPPSGISEPVQKVWTVETKKCREYQNPLCVAAATVSLKTANFQHVEASQSSRPPGRGLAYSLRGRFAVPQRGCVGFAPFLFRMLLAMREDNNI